MQIFSRVSLAALTTALTVISLPAVAQTDNSFADILLEEIIVTGTKRAGGIDVQDAPVAITAYNESQLDAMHIRDVQAIGYSAPSVQLEDIGTTRGTANFSIRGLGINSSIPSIDPTVGVFVDGMYLGITSGVVLDIFDLEGIEVLRGPQGLLFGKNVTGGAVLLRTTRPTENFRFKAKVANETGDDLYTSAVVSGPLSDNLRGKFSVYYNDDGGYFTNLATGNDHGQAQTSMFRGALAWTPTDSSEYLIRYENGNSEGDGPAAQNAGLFGTESFDFSIDEPGRYDNEWNQVTIEATYDIDFGDGEIVNLLGYRDYTSSTLGDIDSSPVFVFHAPARLDQDQISNELRYSGSFDNVYVTTGVFYFQQDLLYLERRRLFNDALQITGGGNQESDTLALFSSVDIEYGDIYTLNLGARYTREKKSAQIAALLPGNGCTLNEGCPAAANDLVDARAFSNFSPKIGLQIRPDEDTLVYGFWTKGFRSGGYNMRHTLNPAVIPNESFDDEEQSSFELGMKKDFADGRVRINVAGYYNKIDNMQREVNLPNSGVGVVQLIRNTADATISGIDFEGSWVLSDSLLLTTSLGYVDGKYDEVIFDIDNDGDVDADDKALKLPRLAPWSYGAQLVYSREFGWGGLTVQGSGYRRDPAKYTDNNRGSLRAADMFNASVSVDLMDGRLGLSAYGKNLKDEVTIGGDTQLPPGFPGTPGATFSPLNKGRVYGFEVIYNVE